MGKLLHNTAPYSNICFEKKQGVQPIPSAFLLRACLKNGNMAKSERMAQAGAAAPQGAGYGAITNRAAGYSPPPCFNFYAFFFFLLRCAMEHLNALCIAGDSSGESSSN
jgi:hypothetical protein